VPTPVALLLPSPVAVTRCQGPVSPLSASATWPWPRRRLRARADTRDFAAAEFICCHAVPEASLPAERAGDLAAAEASLARACENPCLCRSRVHLLPRGARDTSPTERFGLQSPSWSKQMLRKVRTTNSIAQQARFPLLPRVAASPTDRTH